LDIDNCEIDIAFTRTGCKLLSLLDGKVTAGTIRFACFCNANTALGIEYPDDLKQQLDDAKTVPELFETLANHPTHWSWINIQVMEKIASLSSEAMKVVEYYKKVISDMKIEDVLSKIPKFEIDEAFYCKVKEKYSKSLDRLTIKDIQKHQSQVGEIFGINKSALIFIDIVKGCVEIHWLISRFLMHHSYSNYTNQENAEKLHEFGIISVEFLPYSGCQSSGKISEGSVIYT